MTILSGKTENLRDSVSSVGNFIILASVNGMCKMFQTVYVCFQALEFKTKGTQIRRKMWYQNMKIKLVVFGIILLLVLIIWLSICRGFNCTN